MRIECWGQEVERSDGLPWNGWTKSLNSEGPWSFETGSWWRGLEHLANCQKCRKSNKITVREVKKQLRQLEKEWKYYMG